MTLEILPGRVAGAAENMAVDFLLLQRYPRASAPRFRHYGWRAPAFTFGYSQEIAFVRAQLPAGEHLDLCRRATGGGLVDHRDDWTYALVLPRGHPLEELRAAQSYRAVHEALAEALRAQGVAAALSEPKAGVERVDPNALSPEPAPWGQGAPPLAGVCFERAEAFDVVHAGTAAKIAGAAQKRSKHGLLFQGSVARAAVGAALDWDAFAEAFVARLAAALGAVATPTPWPEFDEAEVEGLTGQYASPEWNARR